MTTPGDHLNSEELKERLLSWALREQTSPLFKESSESPGMWFFTIERACRQCKIPGTQRTEVAIQLIQEDTPLSSIMKERQVVYLEKSGGGYWPWPDFKKDIVALVAETQKPGWNWKKIARTALYVAGGAVVVSSVFILALPLIGFTPSGVALGSLAALIQSVFYGAATGGVFSVLQMLGATALVPALIAGASAATAIRVGGRALRD